MMRLVTRLPAVMLTAAIPAYAQVPPNDPMQWLQRAAQSARTLTYTGTYVHTTDDRMSTSRVTHAVFGGDEHERIETLDGPLREFVRRNEETAMHHAGGEDGPARPPHYCALLSLAARRP